MSRKTGRTLIAGLPLLVLCLLGYGTSGPQTVAVTGEVTYDGAPLEQGDILFIPQDQTLAPEAGKIKDGKYSLQAKPGTCRVEIRAVKNGPDTPVFEGQPLASNFLPPEYNLQSKLTAEVKPSGENHFPFTLSSNP